MHYSFLTSFTQVNFDISFLRDLIFHQNENISKISLKLLAKFGSQLDSLVDSLIIQIGKSLIHSENLRVICGVISFVRLLLEKEDSIRASLLDRLEKVIPLRDPVELSGLFSVFGLEFLHDESFIYQLISDGTTSKIVPSFTQGEFICKCCEILPIPFPLSSTLFSLLEEFHSFAFQKSHILIEIEPRYLFHDRFILRISLRLLIALSECSTDVQIL